MVSRQANPANKQASSMQPAGKVASSESQEVFDREAAIAAVEEVKVRDEAITEEGCSILTEMLRRGYFESVRQTKDYRKKIFTPLGRYRFNIHLDKAKEDQLFYTEPSCLNIHVEEASLIHAKDAGQGGALSTYVKVIAGVRSQNTGYVRGSGFPRWLHDFTFSNVSPYERVRLEVWDRRRPRDKLLGWYMVEDAQEITSMPELIHGGWTPLLAPNTYPSYKRDMKKNPNLTFKAWMAMEREHYRRRRIVETKQDHAHLGDAHVPQNKEGVVADAMKRTKSFLGKALPRTWEALPKEAEAEKDILEYEHFYSHGRSINMKMDYTEEVMTPRPTMAKLKVRLKRLVLFNNTFKVTPFFRFRFGAASRPNPFPNERTMYDELVDITAAVDCPEHSREHVFHVVQMREPLKFIVFDAREMEGTEDDGFMDEATVAQQARQGARKALLSEAAARPFKRISGIGGVTAAERAGKHWKDWAAEVAGKRVGGKGETEGGETKFSTDTWYDMVMGLDTQEATQFKAEQRLNEADYLDEDSACCMGLASISLFEIIERSVQSGTVGETNLVQGQWFDIFDPLARKKKNFDPNDESHLIGRVQLDLEFAPKLERMATAVIPFDVEDESKETFTLPQLKKTMQRVEDIMVGLGHIGKIMGSIMG